MTSEENLSKILDLLEKANELIIQAMLLAKEDDNQGSEDEYSLSSDIGNTESAMEDIMKMVRRLKR